MINYCPKTANCALFNNNLLKREESAETFKNLYCKSSTNHKNCKRYIVSEKVGKCADFVMPNSSYTVDEIIGKMKEKGLI
jgi:hypothetical protein